MLPDIEEYREYVDRFDLSEEQKVELIHTLWRITESFVEQAFGIHPVQRCLQAAQEPGSRDSGNQLGYSDQILSSEFSGAADVVAEGSDKS